MPKIWFITGCSKGLGMILTEQLLTNTDDFVVATARYLEDLKELQEQYLERMLVLKLDVTKRDEIKQAVEAAIHRFGRIDILVNNAGYGIVGAFEECSSEDVKAIFETNVFGLMEVTKAVLPYMRAQKSGHILNISSVAGLVAMAGGGVYNSTKFAVEGISEALALEVACFGIKITIIEPGPFRTDFAGHSLKLALLNPDYKDTPADKIREYTEKANNHQAGDPIKAANIIIQVTRLANPPLRLPLGNIAIDRIKAKLESLNKEVSKYEAVARSADYDIGEVSLEEVLEDVEL